MLSIIIPERNEPYLNNTLKSLLDNAEGEIEIFVHIDEDLPEKIEDKRITYLHSDTPRGMRAGINAGLAKAKGKYIMKSDAHCLFAPSFDTTLIKEMQENWLVIPRRYSLHAEAWKIDKRMPVKDYHYLSWPQIYSHYGYCMFPQEWRERTSERMKGYDIDDTMTFQGSCWFADRDYFMKHIGLLDDKPETYSSFSGEQLEVGLKYWLGGGEVKVNKKTWYAHLFKNKHYYEGKRRDRDYKKSLKTLAGWDWARKHWMNNEEPNMIHKIEWLIDKFWPVPNWPVKWRDVWI
jgi:glycosyltransferase involved in cell wall biosynthesis